MRAYRPLGDLDFCFSGTCGQKSRSVHTISHIESDISIKFQAMALSFFGTGTSLLVLRDHLQSFVGKFQVLGVIWKPKNDVKEGNCSFEKNVSILMLNVSWHACSHVVTGFQTGGHVATGFRSTFSSFVLLRVSSTSSSNTMFTFVRRLCTKYLAAIGNVRQLRMAQRVHPLISRPPSPIWFRVV